MFPFSQTGAIISVLSLSLPSLVITINSRGLKHSWICDGAVMLVEGPCGVSVLSHSPLTSQHSESGVFPERGIVDIFAENFGNMQ